MPIKTNWIVLTGGPSSGKTTLVNALHQAGFRTTPEVARTFIEAMLHLDIPMSTIGNDKAELQESILHLETLRHQSLKPSDLIFFDRALPDSLAYYEFNALAVHKETVLQCQKFEYQRVFFLEQLPFETDNIRTENLEKASHIGKLILKAYRSLGYDPILVPAYDIENRLQFILQHLNV